MRRILGPRFNAELESVYTRAFNYVVNILGRAFDAEPISRQARTSSDEHLCVGTNTESASASEYEPNSISTSSKCAVSTSNPPADSTIGSLERMSGDRDAVQNTGIETSKSSLRDLIHPPPLTPKEIYRLKNTWSTKFESYGNMKEAGIETIIRLYLFTTSENQYSMNIKIN